VMEENAGCPLCRAERKTRWYDSNKICWIADCETCHIPMVVARHHGPISDLEKQVMMTVVNYLFEYQSIRKTPRRILNHEHWHIEGARYLGK